MIDGYLTELDWVLIEFDSFLVVFFRGFTEFRLERKENRLADGGGGGGCGGRFSGPVGR